MLKKSRKNKVGRDVDNAPGAPRAKRKKVILAILLSLGAALIIAVLAITLYLSPYLFRGAVEEVIWVNQELDSTDFDVIVVGAEPEGVAAAVSAARNGMRTLLLEESYTLGGLMTLGQLNFLDMCHGRDGTLLTRGIFEEFYNAVGGTAFDITEAKNYFIGLVSSEPLITLRTEAAFHSPIMDGGKIVGVRVTEQGREVEYTGRRVIDATTDGDVAAMAGAPYTYGGEDIGEKDRKMGVTLVFELSGVSWPRVFFHLNMQRLRGVLSGNPVGVGATNKVAWGYEEEGFNYVPRDPMTRLRGPNIARQRGGKVLINALIIFDVDPLDKDSYRDAIERAEAELVYILPYIRENFIGFENAELASTASRLYVRETRHIIGEYKLTIDDVLENRDHWDKIAIGSYPADVQASVSQPYGTVIGNPDRYAIPFRCLVPLYVDNLLIVGRSASFSSLAASSARVLPIGMSTGQAAGAAAAQSIVENVGFREMSADRAAIARLQSTLIGQDVFLEDFTIDEPIMSHWAYEGMATLRRIGLMDGGYQNDYRLEDPVTKWGFQHILRGVIRKTGHQIELSGTVIGIPPTNKEILDVVVTVLGYASPEYIEDAYYETPDAQPIEASERTHSENLEELTNAGLLDPVLKEYFVDGSSTPKRAETAMLLANLYNWLANTQ